MSEGCQEMRLLVQADLDGELDAAAAAALAAHTAGCKGCARLQEDLGRLSGQLHTGLTRHAATPAFRGAILAQVQAASPAPGRGKPRAAWQAGWFGAGMALAASVAVALLPRQPEPAAEAVAAHIRALQPGHLLDVESSDRHTVKPWFNGKLDFAPPVTDFASQGFPLAGGRLDYLAGRPVAALAYRHGNHLIDLFIWPGGQPSSYQTVQGYNLMAWSQNGMNFRAVSDLNTVELGDFARLLQGPS